MPVKWKVVSQLPIVHTEGGLRGSDLMNVSNSVSNSLPSPARLSAAETSCQGMRCTSGQRCQMVSGEARCVAESTAVCRAQGDPHYTTFDGRRYDMMGTCSYTMAELTGEDMSLPAFSVEAKNEHRGSVQVSYVGLVTVHAYSHSVSLVRGETGFARVSVQSLIPMSHQSQPGGHVLLSGPKLKAFGG